jgi:HK97 family phage portal protein
VSFFRNAGPVERRSFAEPPIPPYYGASIGLGGGPGAPSVTTALQQSAVWACVRLVADVVSMMECHGFTMKDQVRIQTDTDPALLRNPSSDATFPEWVYMWIVSLMLRGNFYGRIVRRDAMGVPMQIEPFDPDKVTPDKDHETGATIYRVGGEILRTGPNGAMFHHRAYRMPGSAVGLSPVKYAALAINREAAIQAFTYGYFADAPHPQSVLTSDQPISATEADTLKKRVKEKLFGRDVLVLGAGAKFAPISVSPEESQFLATQKLGVAEIARIYGVPPEMIAAEAGNSMTYANVEQRGIDFLTYSIQPWLTRIENAISSLLPGGQHIRFDPSVLLRTDYHTLVQANSLAIASKQLTPDEARAKMDYAPLTSEQKKILELVPLTVSPSGRPTVAKPGSTPIAELTPTEGAPA